MTSFEWLAAAYLATIAVLAGRHARPRGWIYLGAALLLVIVARFMAPREIRAWLPHLYLVLGYWIPAAFTPQINHRFERWLLRTQERVNARLPAPDSRTTRRARTDRLGNWDLGVGGLELAYLLCYPLVPAAFAVVFVLGGPSDIERFWLAVLGAGYACYGTLPWTAARPPRLIPGSGGPDAAVVPPKPPIVARLNAHVVGRVSHNLNTFPSGHVAVSLVAALAVWSLAPAWGAVFGAMALAIAVAAVTGRYHYAVDVLGGIGVAAGAWATASRFAA